MTKTANQIEQFFSEEVSKDPAVREQLQAATNLESFSKIVVEIGKEKGYIFTQEEVKNAMHNQAYVVGQEANIELEELELESVAGAQKVSACCCASYET